MLITIAHQTSYRYDQALPYALQRIRLAPSTDALQTVLDWEISLDGAIEEVRHVDHFGNAVRLLSVEAGAPAITITAKGRIETRDRSGVLGSHSGFMPLWLYLRPTALTRPDDRVRALAAQLSAGDPLIRLHELMGRIGEAVTYRSGETHAGTSAAEALALGSGVCQDHAHIFVAACRAIGLPARYVSGYLLMDGVTDQVATHAWAEAYLDGLGWVGFDISNGISPDARYVRLAVGRDYRDAAPVAGIRRGQAKEELEVAITVEQ